jgi:hypothetical protein
MRRNCSARHCHLPATLIANGPGLQYANVLAFLPMAVGFFGDWDVLTGYNVRPLKQSTGIELAGFPVRPYTLGFGMILIGSTARPW